MGKPNLKAVDKPEETPEAALANAVTEPAEDPPEGKPAAQVSEHPQFDKRIDELTGELGHLRKQLETARGGRETDKQSFKVLSDQYQEMSKVLDSVETQVSVSTAPDYDENPKAYLDWRAEQTLKGVEKMIKSTTPAQPLPATNQRQVPANLPIDPREAALSSIHDNYYEIMAEVNKDIDADPAFAKAIWGQQNPYKAAYDHGVRKREHAKNLKEGTLSQAYAEVGSGANTGGDSPNTLTPAEKEMVATSRKHGADITEESYLASKIKLAKMRR